MGGPLTVGISDAQRAALATLADRLDPTTYLAGGVAIALRFDHRSSRDLDLFTATADPSARADSFLDSSNPVRVVGRAEGTLHLEVNGVPTSWIRYRYPLLSTPESILSVPVPVASLDDLTCMKLSAIAGRGAARDFWDLREILKRGETSLEHALELFGRKYVTEDIGHVVKSLAYFADADASPLPSGLSLEEWHRIQNDFRAWVSRL